MLSTCVVVNIFHLTTSHVLTFHESRLFVSETGEGSKLQMYIDRYIVLKMHHVLYSC